MELWRRRVASFRAAPPPDHRRHPDHSSAHGVVVTVLSMIRQRTQAATHSPHNSWQVHLPLKTFKKATTIRVAPIRRSAVSGFADSNFCSLVRHGSISFHARAGCSGLLLLRRLGSARLRFERHRFTSRGTFCLRKCSSEESWEPFCSDIYIPLSVILYPGQAIDYMGYGWSSGVTLHSGSIFMVAFYLFRGIIHTYIYMKDTFAHVCWDWDFFLYSEFLRSTAVGVRYRVGVRVDVLN